MKLMKIIVLVALVAACFVTMTLPSDRAAVVQAQAKCGGIEGRVTTPEGWMIPMARIWFFNKDTKKTTNVESNGDGEYEMCLSAGTYDVSIEALGFKSAK